MPQSVQDAVKIWSAPALLVVILALAGIIWSAQESRIGSLEKQFSDANIALTVIAANQQTSKEDRVAFQDGVERRLAKMEDVLTGVGQSLARLAALQEAIPSR